MTLREITREIIGLVEEKSFIPVRVREEPNLPTLATVRIARKGKSPVHLISYKPSAGEAPDYRICFECGFILRLFSTPPEKRFDLGDSVKGQEEVEQAMTSPGGVAVKYRMSKPQVAELQGQFLGGLITHLRSIPVGLRVSQWLETNYPTLKPLEETHVQEELKLNKQTMKEDIKQITPPKVYSAAQAINAAYASFWSANFEEPRILNPYRLQGFEKDGLALMGIYEQMPDDPTYDQALIDAWGKHLGISAWYTWVPYQPPTG